jgi:hypothetical protein
VSVLGDSLARPNRARPCTMDHQVEADAERVRDHLPGQTVPEQHPLTNMTSYTVSRTDPDLSVDLAGLFVEVESAGVV